MPIRRYLDGHQFDAESVRVLGLAFEITRAALKIEVRNEPAKEVIARKLLELAEQGERDPNALAEGVLALIDFGSGGRQSPDQGPKSEVRATSWARVSSE